MASNNNNNSNDARNKKKKRTAGDDGDNYSVDSSSPLSLPTPEVQVVPVVLSFGTIVNAFPDFLLSCVLPYIADRVVWNSIAGSNKDMHVKSKAIPPPWPLYYKLPCSVLWSWSPCGMHIACRYHRNKIAMLDRRRGPILRWQHSRNDDSLITDLKYSPDGRFLVSTDNDAFVRVWNAVTGNYELLQEWNMEEEGAEHISVASKVSISACSKYVAISSGKRVFFKDAENKGNTIKSLLLPFIARNETIDAIRFSSNGHALAIYFQNQLGNDFVTFDFVIFVWRPYLDDNDKDSLITIRRETSTDRELRKFKFSHDNTMVAILDVYEDKGTVWSIDTNHRCLLREKFDFQGSTGLLFTPDGKYIVVNNKNGPTVWSIAEGTCTNKTLHFFDKGCTTKHNNLVVKSFSPDNRHCVVVEAGSGNHYITPYFVQE